MSFRNITTDQHDLFVTSLMSGHYSLLLGAGASMDCENHFGKLPSGKEFKKELCDFKAVSADYSLQQIYSLLTPAEVKKLVTDRFSAAKPGPTYNDLATFVWRYIFTWNIDDALEQAYQSEGARQSLQAFHFTEPYYEPESIAETVLVNLHGSVRKPDLGYVFSRTEYLNNIRNLSHWMVNLTQKMGTEPIAIAGTSLDEIDLDYYLSFRTTLTARDDRGPSILIDKRDDAVSRRICEKNNLVQFLGYTADFFNYCKKVLPNRPTPYDLIPSDMRNLVPHSVGSKAALVFQSELDLVPATAPKSSEASRFLYGHPPTWADLASNVDISRAETGVLIARAAQLLQDPTNDIRLIVQMGTSGSGKTTVLRRAGFECAPKGIRVLLLNSISRLSRSTSSILDLIDQPVIVLVDNFAEHVGSVVEALDACTKKDLVFVVTERPYRSHFIEAQLGRTKYLKYGGLQLGELSAERLIQLYASKGLVGEKDALKNTRKFAQLISSDPIAVACCRILNDFAPLDRIVRELVNGAASQDLERYITVALAQTSYPTGLRYEILSSIASNQGLKAQFSNEHLLPLDFQDSERSFVVTQNLAIAEQVLLHVSQHDRERMFKCFVLLARGIAPRVNRKMIIARSPEARLAGRLLDFDDVVHKYLGDMSDALYEEIKPFWEWNSRYWEQVALLNLAKHYELVGDPEESSSYLQNAVQHSRHAVSIENHPFPLSTLGKILLVQATSGAEPDPFAFDEAVRRLHSAIRIEAGWSRRAAQPYFSLLTGTRNYLAAGGMANEMQSALIIEVLDASLDRFPGDDELARLVHEVRLRI